MPRFSTEYGISDQFFGGQDYLQAKKSGATDEQVLSFLSANPSVLRGHHVRGGGGLYDQIEKSVGETKRAHQSTIDDYQRRVNNYDQEVGRLRDQIGGYRDQIGGYATQIEGLNRDISGYQTRVQDLTGQYNTALQTAEANALARDQFESQFRDATAKYEAEKAEADRYREEAVGQQLRAVRAGRTAGAGGQSDQMRGSLASGRTGYSSDEGDISDLAESMRSQGGLTDSVLSREGPVVQQLSGGQRRGSGGQRQMRSDAGSGSYYASRFR